MGQGQSVTESNTTPRDLPALVKDLRLNGKELETPTMHPVDWKPLQMFTEEDDPDRTRGFAWRVPGFVKEKDPIVQGGKFNTIKQLPPKNQPQWIQMDS